MGQAWLDSNSGVPDWGRADDGTGGKTMREPVSIRTNNPGAMWGGKRANKWGATADLILHDGQSNHIAVFPTRVQGAAAQFDLWRGGYTGMTLAAAIHKW